ncbi:MAG: hypothetical protein U1E28_13970 [Beijerinckiaceae bacterium]
MTKLALVATLAALMSAVAAFWFWFQMRRLRRAEFIRNFAWPPGLLNKLQAKYPGFSRKESALVSEGLRQFFLAYLSSGKRYVAMPSQAADELWHEFILYTRAYSDFCDEAFGGFFHHTPALALAPAQRQSNEGLRRVWWWTCREENINPVRPTRLPLLFALDRKLNIPGGFYYTADCAAQRVGATGSASGHCGGDFADSSVDGSTSGMGDSGGGLSDGGGDGGSDGGSDGGCGGGCSGGD